VDPSAILSQTVLFLTAGVLFYVAFIDLKHYKIRNEVILVLAALFLLHIFLSGHWFTLLWNFGYAALLFMIMVYFYSKNLMGGGDLKLLTVAFLWTGPFCAVPFAVFLLLFVGIHTLAAKLKLVELQIKNGHRLIAFAPSIAAALIAVFMVGCLNDSGTLSLYHDLGVWIRRMVHELLPGIPNT
jgi:prepilin peptidase CpaA